MVPRRPQAEYCGEYCGRCRTLPGVAVTVAHLEALKTFHWPTTPDLLRAKSSNVGGLFRSKYLEQCTLYANCMRTYCRHVVRVEAQRTPCGHVHVACCMRSLEAEAPMRKRARDTLSRTVSFLCTLYGGTRPSFRAGHWWYCEPLPRIGLVLGRNVIRLLDDRRVVQRLPLLHRQSAYAHGP